MIFEYIKMKISGIKYLCFWLLVSFAGLSCEKIIHVNINNVSKKYVIEGFISDSTTCRVFISQTLNIADSNNFYGVPGAKVTVTENGKTPVILSPAKEDGEYQTDFKGKPGNTYSLKVEVGGNVFTASSTMPQPVKLDSVFVTERVFLGMTRKIATVKFRDPPGIKNFYKFVQRVNGAKNTTIFLLDDKLFDGREVTNELLIFDSSPGNTLEGGDQLRVEMLCIEEPVHLYWYSLMQSSLGGQQGASPGNPVSNIKGGALGYFSAHTFRSMHHAVLPLHNTGQN